MRFVLAPLLVALTAAPAFAQRVPAVDVMGGWAGFGDESIIHHGTGGAALRFPLGRRISLGPEVVYMVGPAEDRDVFLHALMVTDLRTGTPERPPRIVPYAVISAGLFWHHDEHFWIDEWYRHWNVNGGFGVRSRVADRWRIGAEARVGSELELRVTGVITYELR